MASAPQANPIQASPNILVLNLYLIPIANLYHLGKGGGGGGTERWNGME